jgi:flagellar basal-body rod protein FlgB
MIHGVGVKSPPPGRMPGTETRLAERHMDLSRTPLYAMISQRMGWLAERQRVIAQNVANADTPGYQSRDLRPLDFGRILQGLRQRLAPVATEGAHIQPSGSSATGAGRARTQPFETTLSGNTVSLEREMTKAADSAVDYQLVTNIYRRQLNMLRTVVGRTGGQ